MNFGIFNGRKIQINNSRFLKIRKKILQLDWIFPNLCAKFQLQIIFFEGFRGGGQLGPSSVSTCQSSNDTYCSLGGLVLGGGRWHGAHGPAAGVGVLCTGGKVGEWMAPYLAPLSKTRLPKTKHARARAPRRARALGPGA
jgi:hypothetical protein